MRPIRMKSFLPAVIAMWVTAACVHDQPSFSPAQQAKPVSPFCEKAIRTIDDASPGAAAFVLIGGGEVVCEHFQSGGRHIDGDTVFSTASFSTWITALGVMRLVESGRVDLDAPVSRYLTRWKLPESLYDDDLVTVRRLLSHTAGLTDGLGFGDYRADEILPSLEESLENPRASNGRKAVIAVGQEPGKTFLYSGGGYLILQLMIEEVSGQRFEIFIDDAILKPLGMVRSSFKYIGDIANTSGSFDKEGKPAPQFKYAAAGATAFSSSARDLTLPIWGLGTILYAQTRGGDHVFGHDGANDPAINVSVRFNPENGDALIVLVSGHPSLATDLGAEWVLAETGKPDIFTLMRRR
jgi:CubicO group peptidase (beta-lactamase class C family)